MKLDSLKVFSFALLLGVAQVASAQTGIDTGNIVNNLVNISEIQEGVTDIQQAVHGQPNSDEYKDGEVGCLSECGNNPIETFHEGISDIAGAITLGNIGNCVGGGPQNTGAQFAPMTLNLGGGINAGNLSNLVRGHTTH